MLPEPARKQTRPVVAMAGIGTEMVGFTLAGVLIDWLAGSLPVFTVLLTVGGAVAAEAR